METMTGSVSYKCPNCAAGLVFDGGKQKFCCEFCLSDFDEAELRAVGSREEAEAEQIASEEFCDRMNEYHCPSCGAEIVCDETTVADICYYCHNPIALSGKMQGQMKPHKIIPFATTKEQAKEIFLAFAKKKWFVPSDFFSEKHADQIRGVYFPFWVTDADTSARMHAKARNLRIWRVGNVEYTETSKYDITREGEIHYEDIVSSALSEADKTMLEGILPYPSESIRDFSMPYLAGFSAKKRDIEREALAQEVRERMDRYADQMLRATIRNYSSVEVESCRVQVKKSHWEYTLMPIWILTYGKRGGRIYTYAMNGHTGKIYGELPLSWGKLAILFGGVVSAATLIFSLLGGMLF